VTASTTPRPLHRIADLAAGLRHVFVRDLVLDAHIGVRAFEKNLRQRVRINLGVNDDEIEDKLESVVCYDDLTAAVRNIVKEGHVHLIETLAERIVEACFRDRRVRTARVRVEKLDIYPDAISVGVEIERSRQTPRKA
jgi:7,8-dihydroneopterin aldolase/epimerase/oxygenase